MLTTIITSVITAVITSVGVSLITIYVYQPIQGQKQLIGEIDVATRQYSTTTSRVAEWRSQGEKEAAKVKAEEATQELLRLSAQLGASPATFPARGKYYSIFEPLAVSRENVSNAASELTEWAYSIRMGDSQAAQRHRLEVIRALGLPRD